MSEFAQAIPPAIWAGIIGALLTLLGVNMQLRYNSRERERDRQMQLRRDVYLEAAEGLAASTDFLFRFTNISIPLAQLGESRVKTTWANKVYTVASIDPIS